jgi:hypothetical protein
MTIDRRSTTSSSVTPPAWAEATLRLVLAPRDRDCISGDLLEEYRTAIVPATGASANLWYVRQVAWYVLRASWLPGVLIATTLIVRYLFDTLTPVAYTAGVVHLRSQVMSELMVAVFVLTAIYAVWRTGDVRTGLLVAVCAAVLGGITSIVATGMMLAIWHDPGTLAAWQGSGGLGEALFGVPLLLVPIGAVTGATGAILGKCLRVFTHWRSDPAQSTK